MGGCPFADTRQCCVLSFEVLVPPSRGVERRIVTRTPWVSPPPRVCVNQDGNWSTPFTSATTDTRRARARRQVCMVARRMTLSDMYECCASTPPSHRPWPPPDVRLQASCNDARFGCVAPCIHHQFSLSSFCTFPHLAIIRLNGFPATHSAYSILNIGSIFVGNGTVYLIVFAAVTTIP